MPEQLSLLDEPAAPLDLRIADPVPAKPEIERWAEMSLDLRYRYLLGRRWAPGALVLWCALNPSDADGQRDDPTLHRMMHFSRAWGYGGLLVVNLAALVSSHPDDLFTDPEPVGALNDKAIREAAEFVIPDGGRLVAGWGCSMRFDDLGPPALFGRDRAVLRLLTSIGAVYCLGFNADRSPKHPHARGKSRAPDDALPVLFAAKGSVS